MKKILAVLMLLTMALSLTACGGGTAAETTTMTAREMYDEILMAAPMNAPQELDDMMLNDLFYVDPALTEEYVAAIALMNVSSDNLAVIKATEGNAEKVAEGLQQRVDDVAMTFERYLEDQYVKAQNALIITKGDWVFMAINDDYEAVETAINGFFGK